MSSTTVHTEGDRNSDANYTPRANLISEESERNSNVHISGFEDKSCQEHIKKLDIVCVDCRIKICASCALFGKHKGHVVRSEEDVLKEISNRAEFLLQMFETVEKNQCYLTDETHIQTVKDYLQSNLKNVLQEIQNKFTEIENKLHQKKEESIKEVKDRFSEMEQKCIQFLTEAPKDAIELTEKWKVDAKDKLLVLCEQNNSDVYSLDLMLDERHDNQNDIIHQGTELLKCIEQANLNLEKQLEDFQFETVYVDFAPNFRNYFDKLVSVSSRQDNELSNLLHTKKSIIYQFQINKINQKYFIIYIRKPTPLSDLSLARQSVDVFNEKIERKASSDKEHTEFKYNEHDIVQKLIGGGGELLDSPQQRTNFRVNESNGTDRNYKANGIHHNGSQHQRHQSAIISSQNNSVLHHYQQMSNRKNTPSIFNNDIHDDNLLLNNDDINEQFNDSVFMTKLSSKFNSPTYFNKVNVEEFMVNSNLGKSHSSEPQLLDGIEQELFGKNIELPNNIDVQLKNNHDQQEIHEGNSKEKNFLQDQTNSQKGKGANLNEKFLSILNEIQKDTIEQADFTYADMGDEGLHRICDALKNNKHLKSLKLQRNKISDKGAIQLLDNMIENQSNMTTLLFQDNMISDKFLDYLLQKCQKGKNKPKKLENIYLKNNLLSINKSQKMIEELKKQSINIFL